MLSSWIRKLVLAAALAVMPLQGMASTLTVLFCHGDAQAHATHAAASHDDHGEHEASHSQEPGANGSEEGSAGGTSAFHSCCNLTASASTAVRVDSALPDFPIRAFVPDSMHDLHVPEQPQRPPLA